AQRTSREQSVLNDRYVSVPVGSEGATDGVSFKHIRKNVHEETLYKCEDERFELDMLIENNASAIRVLEPMLERIKEHEREGRYQFKLDKKCLSTLKLSSITRVYGEHATAMLELLRKNAAAAVEVVLQRLTQKDKEWRTVRDRMNKGWRQVQISTYYKSLDRRSTAQKNEDKKRHGNKYLLAYIRDR
ncbi:unnamed protein product, partial [Choristocarpus tenellus]